VVAYRLISDTPFFASRSQCPNCKILIAWFDNIPIVSWLILRGKCRSCKKPISILYPFIELMTALSLLTMINTVSSDYWFAYFIFFSALIISIRTDLHMMLISRFVTIALVPLGFLLSYLGMLPITLINSILGTSSGFMFLFALAQLYFLLTKRVGLGHGDIELIAFIGAFLGVLGWWFTLVIASCLGSFIGIFILIFDQKSLRNIKIPFGPFLAIGAMSYVIFSPYLLLFIK
jgi:leader peptidase (prepilin peptidase) / N-methyltransferase